MKRDRAETLALLVGFWAVGVVILALCLSAGAGRPDNLGRALSGAEAAEVAARNSPLTEYVFLSPNAVFPRPDRIRKITIHYMEGDLTLEEKGGLFSDRDRRSSANYAIDSQGRVGLYVEERNQAQTSGDAENDGQAVTIEVANDELEGDWHVSDAACEKLIDLCADVCRRNGIPELTFTGGADGTLTLHKMFDPGSPCPGPYLEGRMEEIVREVNRRLRPE